ncbi:FHA domain-containing protein [Parashewanella spongiae]|uniref:FHA domain-containing protein n=1 Tax=Parashewanella spongiae TaxID=342950 RepID=A0A3A6UJH5_9GAMM|nr:FHA domain-containing protein [Parashewanella spongiae]MCL1076793.1 FHA domain-containing protein [Parashewanella spongiae]RJY19282.1 FHA domain-containing protein [Parashewanella spongiae]
MSLSMKIIKSPYGESIYEWVKTFPKDGGDIGRAFGNTFKLSDSTQVISNRHAKILPIEGGYKIIDTSKNGLFINDSKTPLGRNNAIMLSDGDVLGAGEYLLLVSLFNPYENNIDEAPDENNTLEVEPIFADDPFHQLDSEKSVVLTADEINGMSDDEERERYLAESIEHDVFEDVGEHKAEIENDFSTGFTSMEENPFESPLENPFEETSFRATSQTSFDESCVHYERPRKDMLVEHKTAEERFVQYSEKSIEIALNRLFKDIDPEKIEELFKELTGTSFFAEKSRYWNMYKKYFARLIRDRDLHIKFYSYYQEAIKIQISLDGDH